MGEFSDLGKEITDSLQKAVKTGDYRDLNQNISKTVDVAMGEINKGFQKVSYKVQNGMNQGKQNHSEYSMHNGMNADQEYSQQSEQHYGDQRQRNQNQQSRSQAYGGRKTSQRTQSYGTYSQRTVYTGTVEQTRGGRSPLMNTSKGRVKGPMYLFFGLFGTFIFGVSLLVMLILMLTSFSPVFTVLALAVFLPLTVASVTMMINGGSISQRNQRFLRYCNAIGNKTYVAVSDLSRVAGKPVKFVQKELVKLIHQGYFPHGRMDEEKQNLILNQETYEYYLSTKASQEAQKKEQELEAARRQEAARENKDKTKGLPPEVREVLETGAAAIQQIHEANDRMPEPVISQKLDKLEQVIRKIFEYVSLHPEKLPDIKKFLNYYLPTTCKLVNVYQDFELEPVQTESIVKSKKEIMETLDTINTAFENLLNKFMEEISMDISSDIQVLKTMLQQEGLTESDFVSAAGEKESDNREKQEGGQNG